MVSKHIHSLTHSLKPEAHPLLMLTHRGFSAWIVSEGSVLQEHLIAVDSKKHRVQCWIPGEEGKSFAVYWRDHGGKIDTGVASRQGVRTGIITERPFKFSKVEGAGSAGGTDISTKEAGMITLRIKRIERNGQGRAPDELPNIPSPGKRTAGELCVGFGQETQTTERYPSTFSFKRLDGGHSYVTFVFRYRSRAFLRAQGIVAEDDERPPTPRRIPVRRIASAPVTSIATQEPITPSPSPSPKRKTANLGSKMSPLKFHPYKNLGNRPRKAPVVPRVISLRVVKRDDYAGQGLIRFNDDDKPPDQKEDKTDDEDMEKDDDDSPESI